MSNQFKINTQTEKLEHGLLTRISKMFHLGANPFNVLLAILSPEEIIPFLEKYDFFKDHDNGASPCHIERFHYEKKKVISSPIGRVPIDRHEYSAMSTQKVEETFYNLRSTEYVPFNYLAVGGCNIGSRMAIRELVSESANVLVPLQATTAISFDALVTTYIHYPEGKYSPRDRVCLSILQREEKREIRTWDEYFVNSVSLDLNFEAESLKKGKSYSS